MKNEQLHKQFLYIANELCNRFPGLDLRFNLNQGTGRFRLLLPKVPSRQRYVELTLGQRETDELLTEATFAVKEIAQIFDA